MVETTPDVASPQILVVDDEPDLRAMLVFNLKKQGYQVTVAESAQRGLDACRVARFDVVVTDLKMPRMSGLDLLDALKSAGHTAEIIVTTGYGTDATASRSLNAGAFEFMLKPYDMRTLLDVIKRAIARRQKQQELRDLGSRLGRIAQGDKTEKSEKAPKKTTGEKP